MSIRINFNSSNASNFYSNSYDFFLISQSVRQGTVSPTSYNVIHDTMGLPPDKLQILSYKLCHLYFNWSGTTRVPAVVQYAHKLAILVGQYLHQSPSNLLEKQLYFLWVKCDTCKAQKGLNYFSLSYFFITSKSIWTIFYLNDIFNEY